MCIFVDWNNSSINMKKFILIVAALFVGTLAQAQITANGGYIHATESFKSSVVSNSSPLDGFYAGANYYYSLDRFVDGLAVLPGLNLSFLWGSRTMLANTNYTNIKLSEVALNIPVYASYTYKINENFKVFGQTGPSFQFAFSHRASTPQASYQLLNRSNGLDLVRSVFNLYWGIGAGVEVNELLRLDVGYDFGFFNMSRTDDVSIRRGYLHFGVGYLF